MLPPAARLYVTPLYVTPVDVSAVAVILSHANSSTTLNVYAHAFDEAKETQFVGLRSDLQAGVPYKVP